MEANIVEKPSRGLSLHRNYLCNEEVSHEDTD